LMNIGWANPSAAATTREEVTVVVVCI
jgi:hypothetical protein